VSTGNPLVDGGLAAPSHAALWFGPLLSAETAEAQAARLLALPSCIVQPAKLDEVDAGFLRHLARSGVLSPLYWGEGDALDLAARLAEAAYNGPYIVLCPALPDLGGIEREIRGMFPLLVFSAVSFRA
jgi:hypothetical protein